MAKRKAKAKTKEIIFNEQVTEPKVYSEPTTKSVPKNEMEDAIQNAIYQYDTLRKQRKQKKKETAQMNAIDTRLVQQINRAMDPSNPDYWSSCFNIT